MKSIHFVIRAVALSLLLTGALAEASPITGTVINKTTGKPVVGDAVSLVDLQANMAEAAHAKTDAHGRYSLNVPGIGPYLVRATHQGAGYFIAAPRANAPGDIMVYDVDAKVQGISIEADVMEVESDNSQLKVIERYFVHNISSPPLTQWSTRSFKIVLPAEAEVDDVGAQRPTGLFTSIKLAPDGPKGHYSFNFPIQPDDGDKDTQFQLSYRVPYSGKFTFKSVLSLPADSVAVLLPKSMTFKPSTDTNFQSVPEDARIQTFLAKNALPYHALEFTVSGNGSLPRGDQSGSGNQGAAASVNQPDSGPPINSPDPLHGYKGWILGGLALALFGAAAFLLRKPSKNAATETVEGTPPVSATLPTKQAVLLNTLKEELFALESERISGAITPEEYTEAKAALETVLKRALAHGSQLPDVSTPQGTPPHPKA